MSALSHRRSLARRDLTRVSVHRLSRALDRTPPLIRVCLALAGLLVAVALAAPLLAPHDIREQNLLARLHPPSGLGGTPEHPLGTDALGRDVLSRLLFALRTSLGIAALGTFIGLAIGTGLGLLSGLAGGAVDAFLMFLVDTQSALPFTLLALTAIAIFGTDPAVLIVIIGLAGWDRYARVIRGQVLATRDLPYIEASRAMGAHPARIALRHVLPNIASPLIVLATLSFSHIILLESALSFLGLGVQPPYASLGLLLGEGRDYLISAPWIAAIPGIVIVTLSMLVSLIGDWLRDALDPNLDT